MRTTTNGGLFSSFTTLATLGLVVAILRFSQNILVPVAIAILLAFLLSPLVERLSRWGMGKIISVALAATLAFTLIAFVGWIVTSQAWNLIGELPKYEANINAKIDTLKAPHEPTALSRVVDMVERSEKEFSSPAHETREPVEVRMEPTKKTPFTAMGEIAMPILGPLVSAGLIVVLVIAILIGGDDLRDRFIRIVSPTRIGVANQAIDEASRRVFRYLAMQLAVNAGYGAVISIGLTAIGIPEALLWGLIATLLRFIPFLGPWIAASFPIILAIAVDPGWMKPVYVFALYGGMEAITANIVEVWLYGASTGISGLSLLFAAVFWTWLWGPAGLFLSTPLTVWLMVIGKYVPALKFLSVFLEGRPSPRMRRFTGRHAAISALASPRADPHSSDRPDGTPDP